ncbi:MAG: F0F1 ATP synthase subunit A [Bacteroidota bacterium]
MRKFSELVMSYKRLFSLFLLVFALLCTAMPVFAEEPAKTGAATEAPAGEKKGFDATKVIFGHIADSHEWHVLSIEHEGAPATEWAMPLPMIVYQPGKGLSVFLSSKFEDWHPGTAPSSMVSGSYQGLHLERGMKEKLVADDGSAVYDLSITKNVFSMIIGVIILLFIMTKAAGKYKKNGVMTAPSGFQNALEAIISFIRDEVAKPNLGHKYMGYMPLLLSIFFFIWINNLLGLLPSGANFTGNIAVTACLALLAFIVMMAKSNKHYWSHLLNPPGVPGWVKPLLVLIEIMSMFIKPIALMIRLFANMLAGHIVILSVISMIFIFGALSKIAGWGFMPVSIAFSVFMFMLELLVAAIQAFIFTNLTAVFIGQATEEAHGHDDAHDHHGTEDKAIA